MANAFTGGASGAAWDDLTETAYNREADFQLRDNPVWMQTVDTKANRQAMPGDVVVFTIHKDLAAQATTPLTETVDPDAVAAQAPTRVSVTLNEYGNAALATLRLRETAFIAPDPALAEIVGRNMIDTVDTLIRNVADGSTNTIGLNGGTVKSNNTSLALGSVAAGDTFNRNLAAATVATLRKAKVTPQAGEDYLVIAHGDVLYDLMAENSATAWNAPHTYGGDTAAIYNGEVGEFQGARYLRTNRVTIGAGDGAGGTVNVYRSYAFGKQAIAEAVAQDPHIVVGPQIDKLKRFFPLGWYGLLGWSLYRPEALKKIYTSSSINGL